MSHAQSHTASSGQLGFVLVVKWLRQGAQVEGPSHSSSIQGANLDGRPGPRGKILFPQLHNPHSWSHGDASGSSTSRTGAAEAGGRADRQWQCLPQLSMGRWLEYWGYLPPARFTGGPQ